MKNIQFHIRGLNVNGALRQRLEQNLDRLQAAASISAAAVVLDYERDSAPAFRVFVLLAVPGPDVHAEARDHTLEAAWLKVTTSLRRQILRRKAGLESRLKQNGQVRAPVSRRNHRSAGLMCASC